MLRGHSRCLPASATPANVVVSLAGQKSHLGVALPRRTRIATIPSYPLTHAVARVRTPHIKVDTERRILGCEADG